MEEDIDRDDIGKAEFRPQQMRFLQEVKDRAKAVSRNARGNATEVIKAIEDNNEEDDEEMQSYLIKIRSTDTDKDNDDVPRIIIEESAKPERNRDGLEVQVSSVKLNLSAEYAKMGLAQKGRRRRKPNIRWTLREDIFEGVPIPQDAASDDEGRRDDGRNSPLTVPNEDKKRYSAPVFSNSLMSDLGSAVSRRKARPEIDSSNESLNEECSKVPLGMPIAFKVAIGPKPLPKSQSLALSSASLVKTAAALKKTEVTREANVSDSETKPAPWMAEIGKRKILNDMKSPPLPKATRTDPEEDNKTTSRAFPVQVKLSSNRRLTPNKEPDIVDQDPPWKVALRRRHNDEKKDTRTDQVVTETKENNRATSGDEEVVSPWSGVLRPVQKKSKFLTESSPDTNGNDSFMSSKRTDEEQNTSDDEPGWKRYLDAKRELKERRDSREHTSPVILGPCGYDDSEARMVSLEVFEGSKRGGRELKEKVKSPVASASHGTEREKNLKNVRLSRTVNRSNDSEISTLKNNNQEVDLRSSDIHFKARKEEGESQRKTGNAEHKLRSEDHVKSSDGSSSGPQKPAWMKDLRTRREIFAKTGGTQSSSQETDEGKDAQELMGFLRRRRKQVEDAEREASEDGSGAHDKDCRHSSVAKIVDSSSNKESIKAQVGTHLYQGNKEPILRLHDDKIKEKIKKPPILNAQELGERTSEVRDKCVIKQDNASSAKRELKTVLNGKDEQDRQSLVRVEEDKSCDSRSGSVRETKTPTLVRVSSVDDSNKVKIHLRDQDVKNNEEIKSPLHGSRDWKAKQNAVSLKASETGDLTSDSTHSSQTRTADSNKPLHEQSQISARIGREETHRAEVREINTSQSERPRESRIRESSETSTTLELDRRRREKSERRLGERLSATSEEFEAAGMVSNKQGALSSETSDTRDLKRRIKERIRAAANEGSEKSPLVDQGEGRKLRSVERSNVKSEAQEAVGKAPDTQETSPRKKSDLRDIRRRIHGLKNSSADNGNEKSPSPDRRERKECREGEASVKTTEEIEKINHEKGESCSRIYLRFASHDSTNTPLANQRKSKFAELADESRKKALQNLHSFEQQTEKGELDRTSKDTDKNSISPEIKTLSGIDLRSHDQRTLQADKQSSPDAPNKKVPSEMTARLRGGEKDSSSSGFREDISAASGFRSRVQQARDAAEKREKGIGGKVNIRKDLISRAKSRDDVPKKVATETRTEDMPEWLRCRRSKIQEATRKVEPGQGDWV